MGKMRLVLCLLQKIGSILFLFIIILCSWKYSHVYILGRLGGGALQTSIAFRGPRIKSVKTAGSECCVISLATVETLLRVLDVADSEGSTLGFETDYVLLCWNIVGFNGIIFYQRDFVVV